MNRCVVGGLVGAAGLVFLTGCGDTFSNSPFDEDEAFLEALPTTDQLLIDAPDTSSSAARISTDAQSCAADGSSSSSEECDPDALHDLTYETTSNVNGYILNMLELLDRIRSHSPTVRTDDSRIWGPWLLEDEGVYIRLEVYREDADYSYALFLAQEKGATGDVVMNGTYVPGSVAAEGVGAFTFDFTVQSTYIADATRVGAIDVDYDTRAAQVDYVLEGHEIGQEGGDVTDEAYAYYSGGDGSGYFYYSKPVDVYGSAEVMEQASIWSSWLEDGQGRADLVVQGGDLGTYTGTGTECWSAAGAAEYYVMPGCSETGDASLCIASAKGWNE